MSGERVELGVVVKLADIIRFLKVFFLSGCAVCEQEAHIFDMLRAV